MAKTAKAKTAKAKIAKAVFFAAFASFAAFACAQLEVHLRADFDEPPL